MKKIIFIISSALFVLGFTACKSRNTATTDATPGEISIDFDGKYWKLIELDGNSVEEGTSAKEPHIILDVNASRFHGNAGCNTISGSYQLTEPGRITFSQVVATRMMCLDMTIENKFLKTFDTADSYTVKNDTLTLFKDETALARFVVVRKNS